MKMNPMWLKHVCLFVCLYYVYAPLPTNRIGKSSDFFATMTLDYSAKHRSITREWLPLAPPGTKSRGEIQLSIRFR